MSFEFLIYSKNFVNVIEVLPYNKFRFWHWLDNEWNELLDVCLRYQLVVFDSQVVKFVHEKS